MSHYVKFTYERARPDIAPFDSFAELKCMQADTSAAASDWPERKRDRVRQLERPRRRNQEFLYHRFSDGRVARIDADRLRTRRGVRFRKQLPLLRRHGNSIIGIVDACRDL